MNITKMNKRAVFKHLLGRFLKDYQVDMLTFLVAAEFAFIIVR